MAAMNKTLQHENLNASIADLEARTVTIRDSL
jgi:hypothetical protein